MQSENENQLMTIEKLQLKLEQQEKLVTELTSENERLFQQYNHLMVRNNKLLKRIDDMQQIIGDLHIRIEEMQLVNHNQLKLNDGVRNEPVSESKVVSGDLKIMIDNLNHRIEELHLRKEIVGLKSEIYSTRSPQEEISNDTTGVDQEAVYERWKNYPGQDAKNGPNLKKQVLMLTLLNQYNKLSASELFQKAGINGVTGARYVASLKKFSLLEYRGARKKGHYFITEKGRDLLVNKPETIDLTEDGMVAVNAIRVNEFKNAESSTLKPSTNYFENSDL